jgi:integrase
MALSNKQVAHAKAGRHSDGRGLYLLVKPTGTRSWVLRVQHNGHRRDIGLGSVALEQIPNLEAVPLIRRNHLTLAEAREKARIGRELAKAGLDPRAEWKIEVRTTPSFEKAAREYHEQVSKGWRNGKHGAQWITTLQTHAFPFIGKLPVDEVDATEIQRVLMPIWLSIPETARRVRQRIGVVLDYAKGKGWRPTEAPMRAVNQLMSGLRQPKGRSFAALPYRQLPDFFSELRKRDTSAGRLALQFLILTAARSGEVRGAIWDEIDLQTLEWRIPADRMKAGRMHIVPLSKKAIELLLGARSLFGDDAKRPIFPGIRGQPLSDATLAKVVRENGAADATVHGFRSAFRDWAADTGFVDSWAEAALAHGNPNKTEAAYKRTTYFEQRRDILMPRWGAFVSEGAGS